MTSKFCIVNRHIAFERLHNFRDVGGYRGYGGRPVRWGRLYRSESLGKLRGGDDSRVVCSRACSHVCSPTGQPAQAPSFLPQLRSGPGHPIGPWLIAGRSPPARRGVTPYAPTAFGSLADERGGGGAARPVPGACGGRQHYHINHDHLVDGAHGRYVKTLSRSGAHKARSLDDMDST
ncbi:tyrosine-protein phosphatase [Streptomyces atratus]|uniref:tyrosine-protein phosphatase n=1 Tax=Streptomyces atratus TaxID=1893 RepID=UPI001E5EDC9C|nr:tyrosine-protein phosphatase [Streptomyces atratus]WPW26895.1 tyrosine-protein phosphatase [Streptomyces atratus]